MTPKQHWYGNGPSKCEYVVVSEEYASNDNQSLITVKLITEPNNKKKGHEYSQFDIGISWDPLAQEEYPKVYFVIPVEVDGQAWATDTVDEW